MRKKRYEMLLPLKFNDGSTVDPELFEQTREELIAQFGAIAVQPGVVQGVWIHQGIRYEDELLRYMRAEHPGIVESIRDKKEITKETGDKLKAAVEKFAKAFA